MNQWHVMKGEEPIGPFSYNEVIGMLQEKLLFNFDYVWSEHLDRWTRMSDLEEFSALRVERHFKEVGKENFEQRKYPRKEVTVPIYMHNHLDLWHGQIESLSLGGGLMQIENPMLQPGQQVTIHFADGAFNCSGEIVGKRLSRHKVKHDTALYYVVQFVSTTEENKEKINKLLE